MSPRALASRLLLLGLCLGPAAAAAQTMVDQEERLIDIHSLLLDLPPLQAPAALRAGELDASVEAVGIPRIDGTTGSKKQLTASDRTPVFPRPRLLVGLPAGPLRAFVGASYIPPLSIREVSTSYLAGEAGVGLAPGPFRLGARVHALTARSRAPVTDPGTRDVLETSGYGADLHLGVHLWLGPVQLDPYAGGGLVSTRGRFRVESDGNVLRSTYRGAALSAGLRTLLFSRLELTGEVAAYPRRLVHANVRVGYLFHL